ncbi:9904_t:CDS:2 [Entrophospora sp. SA101]|nr:9904_t:CDS:2 [Entrophospora sp. SA101]
METTNFTSSSIIITTVSIILFNASPLPSSASSSSIVETDEEEHSEYENNDDEIMNFNSQRTKFLFIFEYMASLPTSTRQLRACLVFDQFRTEGCDNCEGFLHFKDSNKRTLECTSSKIDGVIANIKPNQSWVSRVKKLDECVEGIYAVGVTGTLPDWAEDAMRQLGINYIPRDGHHIDDGGEEEKENR